MTSKNTLEQIRNLLQRLNTEEEAIADHQNLPAPRSVATATNRAPRPTHQRPRAPSQPILDPNEPAHTIQRRDVSYTTVVIEGGRNYQPGYNTEPDLRVKGGVVIDKDVLIKGNLNVDQIQAPAGKDLCIEADPGHDIILCGAENNFYAGNIISDGTLTITNIVAPDGQDLIISTDPGQSIILSGNNFQTTNIVAAPGEDLCLSADDGQVIKLCNGNDLDMMGANILNIGSLTTFSLTAANAVFGITVFGGSGGNFFEIVDGSLPPGLSLNPTTGQITGTPTSTGLDQFTLMVTDIAGGSSSTTTSLSTVAPMMSRSASISTRATTNATPIYFSKPARHNAYLSAMTKQPSRTRAITPNVALSLNTNLLQLVGDVSVTYISGVIASGGTGGYVYSVQSGTLPPGLTLNSSTGALTGTPSANGTYTVKFRVRDSSNTTVVSGNTKFKIAATPPTFNPIQIPPVAPINTPYNSNTPGNISVPDSLYVYTTICTPSICSVATGGTVSAESNFDYNCIYEIGNVLNLTVCEDITTGNLFATEQIETDTISGITDPDSINIAGIQITNSEFPIGGDVTGTQATTVVTALQGRSVSTTAPTNGQVLTWNSGTSKWTPAASSGSFVVGGDLSGTTSSATVIALQGRPVSAAVPALNNILQWSGTQWVPGAGALTQTLANTNVFVGNALNIATAVSISGDVTIANTGAVSLINTSVPAGSYGGASQVGTFTVDPQGRLTAAGNTAISGLASSALTTTGVTAASYGSATSVPSFTVDSAGRITAAADIPINLSSSSLSPTGVTAGSYGTSSSVPTIMVDSAGRITTATNTLINLSSSSLTNTGVVASTYGSATQITQFTVDAAGRVTYATHFPTAPGGVTSITGTADQVIASAMSGPVTLSLPQNINSTATPTFNQITLNNMPSNSTDAATKAYVDGFVSGVNIHEACTYATTAQLTAAYTPGSADASGGFGIGATLTNSGAQAAFALDGSGTMSRPAIVVTDRILVKNQATQTENGIYTVTTVGDGMTNWVLTRATDADNHIAGQVKAGDYCFIAYGATLGATGWVQMDVGTGVGNAIILGTDNLAYTQTSGAGTYTAGTGLNLAGTVFSNTGVLSIAIVSAGLTMNGTGPAGAVTLTNTGVTSALGTANQVNVSGATGAVIFSLPQSINSTATPTFNQITLNNAPTLNADAATKLYVDNVRTGIAGGDLTGNYPSPSLATSGVSPGTYGNSTQVSQINVDAKGRIISASNVTITGAAPSGIAGGDLTGSFPAPTLATSGVVAGTYGTSSSIPGYQVDAKGRLTLVTPIAITGLASTALSATGVIPTSYGSSTQVGTFSVDSAGRITSATNVTITGAAPTGAAGGDLTGNFPNPTINTLQGGSLSYNITLNNIGIGTTFPSNTTGNANTSFGVQSSNSVTTGTENVAMGYQALMENTTGIRNIAIGYQAMQNAVTTSNNIAVGYQALRNVATDSVNPLHGTNNIAIGCQSLINSTTGYLNIAIGKDALGGGAVSGGRNIAIGGAALYTLSSGDNNVAFGGYPTMASLATGYDNTGLGSGAMYGALSGSRNTAVGNACLDLTTNPSNDTAFGYRAMRYDLAGNNTAVGYEALRQNTSGIGVTAVGYQSLVSNTTGSYNTAMGRDTLTANINGSNNTAFGYGVGTSTTGSNNTLIGVGADSTTSSAIVISNGTSVIASTSGALYFGTHNQVLNTDTSFQVAGFRNGGTELAAGTLTAGTGLTLALATNSVTIGLTTSGVTAGTYGSSTQIPQFQVDATGRLVSATSLSVSALSVTQTTANATYFPTFVPSSATGTKSFEVSPNYSVNPSNGALGLGTYVAIGPIASVPSAVGAGAIAIGTSCVASGANTIAIGRNSAAVSSDIMIGNLTGNQTSSGSNNIGIGNGTLPTLTTGSNNVAIGHNVLQNSTSAAYNVAIGPAAMGSSSSYQCVAIGVGAMEFSSSASSVGIGQSALVYDRGGQNTAVGYVTMTFTTTGYNNSAFGYNTLVANTSGNNNTAIGVSSLRLNTGGSNNVAIGSRALFNNIGGGGNTAVGTDSALLSTTGTNNTALGNNALYTNISGNSNTAVGYQALNSATGSSNTAVGNQALFNASETFNTAVGGSAGSTITTGSNLTCLGYNAEPSSATATNEVTLGDTNVTVLRMGGLLIGVSTPNNTNAAAAGVPLYGFYRSILDPAIIYQRTA